MRGLGAVAWGLCALAIVGLTVFVWLDQILRQSADPDLVALTPTAIAPVLGAVTTATAGAVVASRRPRHPVGWLLLALGLSLSAAGVALAYTNYAVALGDTPPGAELVARYLPATIVTAIALSASILVLTPTGKLPSSRWSWLVGVTVAVPLVLLLVVALLPTPSDLLARAVNGPLDLQSFDGGLIVAYRAAFSVVILALAMAAAGLVFRFRRASGVERQQLRWVAFATVLVGLLALLQLAALAVDAYVLATLAGGLNPAILSAGIGAAVLRYRLYDLDRIISRTVSYGLLTVLLGGVYAAVVVGLSQLFGRGSSLVVAAATLAVAAAFQPARRRIQQLVDRRFNRLRYDAAQTMAAFGQRLRREVDMDRLSSDLLAVADRTMQPARVSLWLRPPAPEDRSGGVFTEGSR